MELYSTLISAKQPLRNASLVNSCSSEAVAFLFNLFIYFFMVTDLHLNQVIHMGCRVRG